MGKMTGGFHMVMIDGKDMAASNLGTFTCVVGSPAPPIAGPSRNIPSRVCKFALVLLSLLGFRMNAGAYEAVRVSDECGSV